MAVRLRDRILTFTFDSDTSLSVSFATINLSFWYIKTRKNKDKDLEIWKIRCLVMNILISPKDTRSALWLMLSPIDVGLPIDLIKNKAGVPIEDQEFAWVNLYSWIFYTSLTYTLCNMCA